MALKLGQYRVAAHDVAGCSRFRYRHVSAIGVVWTAFAELNAIWIAECILIAQLTVRCSGVSFANWTSFQNFDYE